MFHSARQITLPFAAMIPSFGAKTVPGVSIPARFSMVIGIAQMEAMRALLIAKTSVRNTFLRVKLFSTNATNTVAHG